jgi:hypothetical protein
MVGARWGSHYGICVVVLAEVIHGITKVVVQRTDYETVPIFEWHVPTLAEGQVGGKLEAAVGDDTAPDEVSLTEGRRETLKYVSAAFSSGACMVPLFRLVCLLVWQTKPASRCPPQTRGRRGRAPRCP